MDLEQALQQINTLKAEKVDLQGKLNDAKSNLSRETKDREAAQSEVAALKTTLSDKDAKHATQVSEFETKLANAGKENEGKLFAAEARLVAQQVGMHNPDDVVRFIDMEGIKRGEDGKIEGISEAVEALKTDRSYLFKASDSSQPTPPPANPSAGTTGTEGRRPVVPPAQKTENVANMNKADYERERAAMFPDYRPNR